MSSVVVKATVERAGIINKDINTIKGKSHILYEANRNGKIS